MHHTRDPTLFFGKLFLLVQVRTASALPRGSLRSERIRASRIILLILDKNMT